jgi:hypothetical protein
MRLAPLRSFKRKRRSDCPSDTVPSEACYHHELFHALVSWLGRYDYQITSEVSSALARPGRDQNSNRQRLDLMVGKEAEWRCTIEISASAKPNEVSDHFSQALAYGTALRAHDCWAINVELERATPEGDAKLLLWPPARLGPLGVIHIIHDIGWTKAVVHVRRPPQNGRLSDVEVHKVELARDLATV